MAAVYQAYIDDAGKGQPPAFVLAGFVATAQNWAAFSDEWAAALLGPPKLEYFKMQHAAQFEHYPEFRGWTESQRDERLRLLTGIIEKHAIMGIACVVASEDYRKVFRGKIARGMDSPYHFAFYSVMAAVHWLQHYVGDENAVDFIFDEQGKEIGRALRTWKAWIELAPPQLKKLIGRPPISGNDKTDLPLQAADLLAWRTRRYIVDLKTGADVAERLLPFNSIDVYADTWDKERLAATLAQVTEKKRSLGGVFPYDLDAEKRRRLEKALAAGRIKPMADDL